MRGGELWLEGMHIPPYEQGDKRTHQPLRPRKLLLHRREIEADRRRQQEKSLSLVPLRVYFTHGIAKVEIGVGAREAPVREAAVDRASARAEREIERADRPRGVVTAFSSCRRAAVYSLRQLHMGVYWLRPGRSSSGRSGP